MQINVNITEEIGIFMIAAYSYIVQISTGKDVRRR